MGIFSIFVINTVHYWI
ncbi:TPA: erythromycin resistance leader peptide [Enterococcus faecium]